MATTWAKPYVFRRSTLTIGKTHFGPSFYPFMVPKWLAFKASWVMKAVNIAKIGLKMV